MAVAYASAHGTTRNPFSPLRLIIGSDRRPSALKSCEVISASLEASLRRSGSSEGAVFKRINSKRTTHRWTPSWVQSLRPAVPNAHPSQTPCFTGSVCARWDHGESPRPKAMASTPYPKPSRPYANFASFPPGQNANDSFLDNARGLTEDGTIVTLQALDYNCHTRGSTLWTDAMWQMVTKGCGAPGCAFDGAALPPSRPEQFPVCRQPFRNQIREGSPLTHQKSGPSPSFELGLTISIELRIVLRDPLSGLAEL